MSTFNVNALYASLTRITDRTTQEVLRQQSDAIASLLSQAGGVNAALAGIPKPLTLAEIKAALQANGSNPLVITGLPGQTAAVTFGTHATRPSPANSTVGTFYLETDREALYTCEPVASANAWVFVAGLYQDVIANRPTDLGANDKGFRFYANDSTEKAEFIWDGTAWMQAIRDEITDAITNTTSVTRVESHKSTGTTAAGFGARTLGQLQNAAGSVVDASAVDTAWSVATAGSESSDWIVSLRQAGAALAKAIRVIGATLALEIAKVIQPQTDSTTAIQITKADGTTVILNVDSTNKRVGINNTSPAYDVDAAGDVNVGSGKAYRINGAIVLTIDGGLTSIRELAATNGIAFSTDAGVELAGVDQNGNVIATGGLEARGATPSVAGATGIGTDTGFGTGAAGTAVTTTLKGGGTGPTTPQTVVNYLKITLNNVTYWAPLMQ